MRITINFSREEKHVIAKSVDANLLEDYKEVTFDEFGSVVYDPAGEIEINLKDTFVFDLISKIESVIDIFTGFAKRWFGKTETKMYNELGEEIVKVYNSDGGYTIKRKRDIE